MEANRDILYTRKAGLVNIRRLTSYKLGRLASCPFIHLEDWLLRCLEGWPFVYLEDWPLELYTWKNDLLYT